jgi:hypothetical protein
LRLAGAGGEGRGKKGEGGQAREFHSLIPAHGDSTVNMGSAKRPC